MRRGEHLEVPAMSQPLISAPHSLAAADAAITVIVGDQSWVLGSRASWDRLRASAIEGEDILLDHVPTFRLGWNRNHVSPDKQSVKRFTKQIGVPLLLWHEESELAGVIVAGSFDGQTLR